MEFLCVHGVCDSAGHGTLALTRTALLPSVQADAVGSLFRRFRSSIPSPHMPLSNASSAASRLPSHGSGSGWSLLLSCVTLSFTTPRRFIPTLSSQDWLPHKFPQHRGVNLISEKRHMIIGVPTEIKDHETRVGLVPS